LAGLLGEKRKAATIKEKSTWENQNPGGEVEAILDKYAAHLAAVETAAARRAGETERTVQVLKDAVASHNQGCSPKWVSHLVSMLIGLLAYVGTTVVARYFSGDDAQNAMLMNARTGLIEIQKDIGFLKGQIQGHESRLDRSDNMLRELELDKARREALDGRRK